MAYDLLKARLEAELSVVGEYRYVDELVEWPMTDTSPTTDSWLCNTEGESFGRLRGTHRCLTFR